MEDKIKVFRVPKKEVANQCEQLGFKKRQGTYKHLTDMPISSFTYEEIEKLKKYLDTLQKNLNTLENTTIETIWLSELDAL